MIRKVLLFLPLLLFPAVNSPAQAPYYQGKTITFIVGSGAGTAYDMYGRLLANHISKYIPGNPGVVVQNMPAAGGIVAANYAYGIAKPDGLTVVSINPAHSPSMKNSTPSRSTTSSPPFFSSSVI